MLTIWIRNSIIAAMILSPMGILTTARGNWLDAAAPRVQLPNLVELRPGTFRYRLGGEFTRADKPVIAPMVMVRIERPLTIMRHQVKATDYLRCVEAGACVASGHDEASDLPVVGVSWRDAHDYASWLSRETGVSFRLPTDEEWAYAAAERVVDDALPEDAYVGDPGRRMLAKYDQGKNRERTGDKNPRPIGSFGVNENDLLDVAGNVWEWTDTCFERATFDERGGAVPTGVNCGVRIAAGRHRAYVPDFIGNASAGGCSVGTPPSNLGIRLVRDDAPWSRLRTIIRWCQRLVDPRT